jgi:hypothetical protein
MMKQVMNALQTENTKLTSMEEERVAKILSFGDNFGHLFVHEKELQYALSIPIKRRTEKTMIWYAVWDTCAQNFDRKGSDEVYVTPTVFGQSHK